MYRLVRLLILAVLTASTSLAAESRFFVVANQKLLDVDVTRERLGHLRRVTSLPGLSAGRPQVFAGGRYLAWGNVIRIIGSRLSQELTIAINVADVDTGQVFEVPGLTFTSSIGSVFRLIADPLRTRLLVQSGTRILVLDGQTFSVRSMPLPFERAFLMAYAARSEEMLFRREDGTIAFVGVYSGQVRETSIQAGQYVVIEPNGNRLFTFTTVGDIDHPERQHIVVNAYHVRSAMLVTRGAVGYPFLKDMPEYDAARDRLLFFAGTFSGRTDLIALDASSLTLLAAVDVAVGPPPVSGSVTIETFPAHPYVLLRSQADGGCSQTSVHLLDPTNGAHIAAADVAALWAPPFAGPVCFFSTTSLGPPAPPVRMRATVQRRRVSLSWEDLTYATDFEIEAGNGPNLRNLGAIRTGGPTSFEADDVPSGTYFLRVFGLNHQGRSGPSTEVVLTVP